MCASHGTEGAQRPLLRVSRPGQIKKGFQIVFVTQVRKYLIICAFSYNRLRHAGEKDAMLAFSITIIIAPI